MYGLSLVESVGLKLVREMKSLNEKVQTGKFCPDHRRKAAKTSAFHGSNKLVEKLRPGEKPR